MRMIPAYIDDLSPPGEKTVFSRLQSVSKDWVVIHSLDLAPYNDNKRTEIDFVIVVPDRGVLCVEVKSHRDIFFNGERWHPDSIKRSPFSQAMDARYAFRRRLVDRFGNNSVLGSLPVLHLCMFPNSIFVLPSNMAIHNYEVMDMNDFSRCKTAQSFCQEISRRLDLSIHADPHIAPLQQPISSDDLDALLNFCLPIQRRKPDSQAEIRYRHDDLCRLLREQQKPVLNLVANNNRVLVEGGAGTGKSIIGKEVAKRMFDAGMRVGFFCYNRLVGQLARRELEGVSAQGIVAGPIVGRLMELTGITAPNGADQNWWDNILPLMIEERLLGFDAETLSACSFDYLVIDEAQDIIARSKLWDCLDLLLDGGFDNGRCLVLGDFVNQVLGVPELVEAALVRFRQNAVRWPLLENCRNYQSIGHAALLLSAADPLTYSGYMREGGGIQMFDIKPYQTKADQATLIIECIHNAKNSGFRDSDITLLTFCTVEKSVVRDLVNSGVRLSKAGDFVSEDICYASVNAFKGMENKVIIITDVSFNPADAEYERTRFYTGMTRATEKLFIFCTQATTQKLIRWIQ